jgi:hypothetical protein
LLDKILGYLHRRDKVPSDVQSVGQIVVQSVGVDLDLVFINPSMYLWYGQCVVYTAMPLLAFIALIPFFLSAFYLFFLWLLFAGLIALALRKARLLKNSESCSFAVTGGECRLAYSGGASKVKFEGEIVLWSWLIVIPLQDPLTRKKYSVIALRDSMSQQDWRRLCVWLKICGFKK